MKSSPRRSLGARRGPEDPERDPGSGLDSDLGSGLDSDLGSGLDSGPELGLDSGLARHLGRLLEWRFGAEKPRSPAAPSRTTICVCSYVCPDGTEICR